MASALDIVSYATPPYKGRGFVLSNYVLTWVWKQAPVTDPTCLLVLASLADQANDDGYCWPSIRSTAARCRISDRQTQRWITRLVEMGLLEVRERPGTSNMYRIVGGDAHDTPRGDAHVTGGVTPMSGGVRHPRHPNHKEPKIEPPVESSDTVSQPIPRCNYCSKRLTGAGHNCSAMNQYMRHPKI